MSILQLVNDYFGTSLYARLFEKIDALGVDNQIFVPVRFHSNLNCTGNIKVAQCYSALDRIAFFPKQRETIAAIKQTYDIESIDAIHAHTTFSSGYAAYKLYREYGIPYIVAVRNTDVGLFFKYMLHLRKIGVEILRNAAKIIFLSPAYKEYVIDRYVPEKHKDEIKEKSMTIPNGIDSLFLNNQPSPHICNTLSPRIIYVGEVSRNKNLETTVDAVNILRKKNIDVKVTVVGRIKEKKYAELIERTPFIEYFPQAPKEEVLRHMRNSDIFVMPSHAETFGLVYAEAISQGLPVLYTKGQGFDGQFPEGEVGFHIDDRSPEDIVKKVAMILNDYTAMSRRCIINAHKFDWASIAKTYVEIYEKAKADILVK